MPAFDVTASPAQLTLKAGETGTVVVTVTNRLGRSVIARADKVVEPATSAAWVKAPANSQRTFTDQKTTEEFRYEIAIPAGTAGTSFKFRVDVVEVDAPDDNFGQGNTVAVTVPAEVTPPPPPNGKIPVWVWPVAAIVLIGIGVGVWLMLRGGGGDGMPNLVGQPFDAARASLEEQSIVVVRADSLSADTVQFKAGAVIAQTPLPDSALKNNEEDPDTARLVVQKDFTVVPSDLASGTPVDAAGKLGLAGLVAKAGTQRVSNSASNGKVMGTVPAGGALAARGDTVTIQVGWFCPPPCHRLILPGGLLEEIQRANTQKFRPGRLRLPGQ